MSAAFGGDAACGGGFTATAGVALLSTALATGLLCVSAAPVVLALAAVGFLTGSAAEEAMLDGLAVADAGLAGAGLGFFAAALGSMPRVDCTFATKLLVTLPAQSNSMTEKDTICA